MRKNKLLKPGYMGNLRWTRNGEPNGDIRYACYQSHLQLNYRYREGEDEWKPIEQQIYFERTPCHYGGERLWFLCPRCNRRVGVLCAYDVHFLCRHCYQLPYSSQQESRIDRIISQKHKLGARIFEHYEYGEGFGKKKGITGKPLTAYAHVIRL